MLHRYFADISTILSIFCRFFRRSIIGDDYRFDAARYPIFLRNIGDIFRFFNPWEEVGAFIGGQDRGEDGGFEEATGERVTGR